MTPTVPRLYELIELECADSALAEACRRAQAGAEEGALVWVRRQTAGEGRPGKRWESAGEGLYAALVLRPDMPVDEAAELVFVASLAMGQAVAEQVPALVELHYRWPNDVLLRHGKVAGIQLRAGPVEQGRTSWLVLGVTVNIAKAPPEFGFAAATLREDGESSADAGELLEGFARHLLSWIARWDDQGFEPVRKAWLQRLSVLEPQLRFDMGDGERCGRYSELGPRGELVLLADDGSSQRVTVTEFFGLEAESS